LSQLAEVRGCGYAVDRQELEPHLCCVAGPVFDGTGIVVASISVSGPDSRIDDTTIPAHRFRGMPHRRPDQRPARRPRSIPEWRSPPAGELTGSQV